MTLFSLVISSNDAIKLYSNSATTAINSAITAINSAITAVPDNRLDSILASTTIQLQSKFYRNSRCSLNSYSTSSAIRTSSLYLAIRSERLMEPVLI